MSERERERESKERPDRGGGRGRPGHNKSITPMTLNFIYIPNQKMLPGYRDAFGIVILR